MYSVWLSEARYNQQRSEVNCGSVVASISILFVLGLYLYDTIGDGNLTCAKNEESTARDRKLVTNAKNKLKQTLDDQ